MFKREIKYSYTGRRATAFYRRRNKGLFATENLNGEIEENKVLNRWNLNKTK